MSEKLLSLPHLPFSRPSMDEATIDSVVAVLRSGWLTSGKHVLAFEQAFSELVGAPYAIAVSSGTAGLDMAIAALDLKPGDEVIVPSINWVSGPNMVELHGGVTIFCEIDPTTLLMDVGHAQKLISKRTRAIMPVHFAGAPCQLDAIYDLAHAHGLAVIEDAAHATGTRWRGQHVGSHQRGPHDCAIFSFHPSKNITTGEGGMITCHDSELASRLKLSRFHGIRKDAWKNHSRSGRDVYQVEFPGRKYNLTDLQAVIGVHQLQQLNQFNAQRTQLALRYHQQLDPDGVVQPLALPNATDTTHAWHIFVVIISVHYPHLTRDVVVAALEAQGIGTALHFPPVHRQAYYASRNPIGSLPISEDVGERLLSLPLFPGMTNNDIDRVAAALNQLKKVTS
jgi:UDP-4-amino-4-deoxy-L-arabinose-oxoglutarate aminotransferase